MWSVVCKIMTTWLCLCLIRSKVSGELDSDWCDPCENVGVSWAVSFRLRSYGIYGEGLVGDGGAWSHPGALGRHLRRSRWFLSMLLQHPAEFFLKSTPPLVLPHETMA